MRSGKEVFLSLKNPGLIISLFITTMMIQIASNSVNPILTLYVRDLAGNAQNIAFISGMIASVPGVAALIAAPRLGRWGDRIGSERILLGALIGSMLLQIPMAFAQNPLQLGILRFLLGLTDGALLPAVQSLLTKIHRVRLQVEFLVIINLFNILGMSSDRLLGQVLLLILVTEMSSS